MKLRFFGPGGRAWWLFLRVKHVFREQAYRLRYQIGKGDNKDKHFYVIGVDFLGEGLFSIVNSVVAHIAYALERGWIPVVDMENFQSIYQRKGENAWESFFEQPCGYNLSAIRGSNRMTLSYNINYPRGHRLNMRDEAYCDRLKQLYARYIRPQQSVRNYLEEGIRRVSERSGETIGCICRGTDYTNTLVGLPKQPTAEMVIRKVREQMQRYGATNVYCATEDARIYRAFQEEFGEQLIPNTQQKYADNEKVLLHWFNEKHGIDEHRLALQYMQSMYMVMHCDYFVGGRVSGTQAVILMPNRFKDVYMFNLGTVTQADIDEANRANK